MFDGNRIPLVQVTAQLEILVDGIAEVALPHLTQPLGQIVHDEAILVREELRPHLGNLPAWDICMEAVEESRVDHRLREWGEEMTRLHQRIDRLVDIANEHHRGVGVDRITATGERSRSHVVLHDLDTILIFKGDARHFIEGHHIPQADQTDLTPGHVVEQVGDRGLTARHENAVRADFFVNVALARASWPKLGEVVVVLDQWNHAGQKVPLHSFLEVRWLHAG